MITPKPGQLCTINHTVYRAKKRDITNFLECTGCDLQGFFKCPSISYANTNKLPTVDCDKYNVILKKI